MEAVEVKSARLTTPPLRLIVQAIGGPRQIAGKLRAAGCGRCGSTSTPREIDRRLRDARAEGLRRSAGRRALQILFGGLDMLRFVIEPASRDYYRQKGISFGFHQLLRVLDDPVSMIDPTGFLSERDTIVGHVMQVVHLNPVYDLQLIQMFPDGLEDFERQVAGDGRRHPSAPSHDRRHRRGSRLPRRLLDYVRRFRADPDTPPPVREEQTLRADPHFAAAERTFATLPGFIRYCHTLPTGGVELVQRLRSLQRFPLDSPAILP